MKTILSSKKNILLINLILISVLFHTPIENIYSLLIVKPALTQIRQYWINDIAVLTLLILFILWFQKKWKYYSSISIQLCTLISVLSLYYIFHRIEESRWTFISFSFLEKIKYADVTLFVPIGFWILFVRANFKKESPKITYDPNSFILDSPISDSSADDFNRSALAKRIAHRITATSGKESFAVAITSPWGTGKTSFLNLIKEYLPQKGTLIIDFNPEHLFSDKEVISGFYATLVKNLSGFDSQLNSLLIEYGAELLTNTRTGLVKKILNDFVDSSNGNDSLKEKISKRIDTFNLQVVVFVDDLDRLDKKELSTVIRFIRNTIDFRHLKFVTAFDRDYVLEAIQIELNVSKYNQYLEKIFVAEYILPKPDSSLISKYLLDVLKKAFPDKGEELHELFQGRSYKRFDYLHLLSASYRDAKRFLNNFVVNYAAIKNDVVLSDFLSIETIRFKYPHVYQILAAGRKEFFKTKQTGYEYQVRLELDETKEQKLKIENYLSEKRGKLHINENDIPAIVGILKEVFNSHLRNYDHLRINNPDRFQKYFEFDNRAGELTEDEFNVLMSSEKNLARGLIDNFIKQGKKYQLLIRLNDVGQDDIITLEYFDVYVDSILYLIRRIEEEKTNESFVMSGSEICKHLAIIFVSTYDRTLNTLFNGSVDNKNEYLFNIFESAQHPYIIESELAFEVLNEDYSSKKIDHERLNNTLLFYVKKYTDEVRRIDKIAKALYHNCYILTAVEVNYKSFQKESKIDPRAVAYIKEISEEYALDDLIDWIIQDDRDSGKYYISDLAKNMYGSWSAFQEYIESVPDIKFKNIAEFKKFLKLFLVNEPLKSIEFDFVEIPVTQKMVRVNF